jgi:hypothetical protein
MRARIARVTYAIQLLVVLVVATVRFNFQKQTRQ